MSITRFPDLMGMPIIVSYEALKETTERLFPVSRHRSKRIHKKLVKRFGGEFRMVPTIWKMRNKLMVHPALYAQFLSEVQKQSAPAVPDWQRKLERAIAMRSPCIITTA